MNGIFCLHFRIPVFGTSAAAQRRLGGGSAAARRRLRGTSAGVRRRRAISGSSGIAAIGSASQSGWATQAAARFERR